MIFVFLNSWLNRILFLNYYVSLHPQKISMSIWHNIFCVITAPKYGWELINESNIPVGKVMRSVYVPLLVILALSCFVPMIYDRTLTFSYSLLNGIVMVSSFFVAYFIIVYLLGGFYPELVKTEGGTARMSDFILYNLIFMVLLPFVVAAQTTVNIGSVHGNNVYIVMKKNSNKPDYIRIPIETSDAKEASIHLKVSDASKFRGLIFEARMKYMEWVKVAEENDVGDFSKDLPVKFPWTDFFAVT